MRWMWHHYDVPRGASLTANNAEIFRKLRAEYDRRQRTLTRDEVRAIVNEERQEESAT